MAAYVTPAKACKVLGVSISTLRRWDASGKIKSIRNGVTGHRRFDISSVIGQPKDCPELKYCYARVSTREQKGDLERQIEYLRSRYPDHHIVSDIGSGVNFKRKGLRTILDAAIRGDLKEVVVTHRDRLCRFGFDLIQYIIRAASGAEIVVLNDDDESTPQEELCKDLISIVTVFTSKYYGLRRYHNDVQDQVEPVLRVEEICTGQKGEPENIEIEIVSDEETT